MNKQLRSLIDRAERLLAEREEVAAGIKDLRTEMKSDGYDAAQIMRLAQLSLDDKKRAKLATANEVLSLYNRESGLGLDLGLDETDHGSDARPVPQAEAAGKAVTADPIGEMDRGLAKSEAASERPRDSAMAARAADPVKPSHGGNGTPQESGVREEHRRRVANGTARLLTDDDLTIPRILDRTTPENAELRRQAPGPRA